MNSPFSKIHDVPVVGYAWRLVVGLVRLPSIVRSYEGAFRELHGWQGGVEQRLAENRRELEGICADIGRAREQLGAETGQFRSLLAAEQQGAHGRLAAVEQRVAAFEQRVAAFEQRAQALDQQLAQAQGAFERHVPTLLNVVSSHAALARLLRREQAAIHDRADAVEGRAAAVEARAVALEQQFKAAAAAMQAEVATAQGGVAAMRGELAAAAGAAQADLAGVRSALQAQESHAAGLSGAVESLSRSLDEHRGLLASLKGLIESAPDARTALQPFEARLQSMTGTLEYLLNRVEFVRREALFELRYGREPSGEAAIESRVVNPDKVKKALAKGLRLNVGCGHIPVDGYVNVDRRELPHVDVVAEADHLPFEKGSVAELYSAHLVEHFPKEQLRRELLPYWKSLLKAGGTLRCVVPDAQAMLARYGRGEMDFEVLREVTFGSQDYAGDFHYNMFTPESLAQVLEEAGFRDVSFPAKGRVNGLCLEMEAVAKA